MEPRKPINKQEYKKDLQIYYKIVNLLKNLVIKKNLREPDRLNYYYNQIK
jgi:hypothetical protein